MPPRGGGRGARLRAIVLRAAGAVAIAAFLWWRDHERAAVVLLALAATLTVAASLSPALAAAAERVEAVIRRYAGRFLSLVFLTAVYLLVFLPLSLLLRLFAVNPLQMGRSADDQSAWRPAQKHPRRPLYKRPFAYDRIPHTAASRGLRLRAALGLIIIIIALDLALGAALDAFDGSDAPSAQNSEVNLVSAPDTPAGATEPWRAQLGQEIGQAWVHKRYDPFLSWRMVDYRGRYVNLSDGVRRSYEAPGAGGPDAVTVYFMGGSTMFGSFQRDGHTIPSEFARLAEADGIPVRVVNYGQLAYVNWQEVLLLQQLASGSSRPDLAVFYDGYNDLLSQFALGHHREPTTLDAQEIEKRLALGTAPDDPSVWQAGVRRLEGQERRLQARPRAGPRRRAAGAGVADPLDHRAGRPPGPARHGRGGGAAARGRRGARLGDTLGFKTAFFWQPSIYSKRVVTGRGGGPNWLGADPKAWQTATRAARARLAAPW